MSQCFEVQKLENRGEWRLEKCGFLVSGPFLWHMLIEVILFGVHFKMVAGLSNFDTFSTLGAWSLFTYVA